jgi:ABC-type Fe3+-hydroxamate transport system substrate-binding protein
MKSKTRVLLLLLISLFFSGCATTGPTYTDMQNTMTGLNSDSGRIYIYRPSALGAAIQPTVYVNDEAVGKAVSYGFVYVDRAPGAYTIKTTTEVKRTLSLNLGPGETCYVRLNISMGFFAGHVYPELVEKNVGESEIKDCHYIGGK